jgi:hypothetical protein
MSKPISSDDISQLMDGKVKIISYSQLKQFKNIDELLEPFGKVVILYESKKNYGHWTCLFVNPVDNTLNFFDSYGIFLDDELEHVPENYKKKSGYGYVPLLSILLYKSGYPVNYNHFKLQGRGNHINTCGKWCVLRLINSDKNEYEFAKPLLKMRKKGINLDEFLDNFIICTQNN